MAQAMRMMGRSLTKLRMSSSGAGAVTAKSYGVIAQASRGATTFMSPFKQIGGVGQQLRMFSDSNNGGDGGEGGKSVEDFESLDDYLMSIDTSFPEEKRAHVEALKKQIKGGHLSKRSLYRDVPTPEELEAIKFQGNFLPKIAPNAEALIDWALSHVPERAGPRRNRRAKRMANKWRIKRADDARRKNEKVAAIARDEAKRQVHRAKANEYRMEGARLRGEAVPSQQEAN